MLRMPFIRLAPLLALAVVCCLHSTAWAQGAGHTEAAGEEPWYVNVVVGVFTIVAFLVVLLILRWKAWGPIVGALEKREQNLHGAHADAQKLREDAAQLRIEWEKKMAEIQDQVRKIHEEARRQAERNAAEIASKARADIQSERDRLRHEIDVAKDQALAEIWRHTADLVTEVSSRAIRRHINGEDQRRLVEDALAELKTVQN